MQMLRRSWTAIREYLSYVTREERLTSLPSKEYSLMIKINENQIVTNITKIKSSDVSEIKYSDSRPVPLNSLPLEERRKISAKIMGEDEELFKKWSNIS